MNAFPAGKRQVLRRMIHDVIRTANPFPYTVKIHVLSELEIIKLNK